MGTAFWWSKKAARKPWLWHEIFSLYSSLSASLITGYQGGGVRTAALLFFTLPVLFPGFLPLLLPSKPL